MREAVAELADVELAEIEAAVGATSFKRGRAFANGGRVLKLEWDPEVDTLLGRVIGNGGLYEACAWFAEGEAGALEFAEGECSCPIGWNCKHVAALVIAAKPKGRIAGARPATASSWETPLRALIAAPAARTAGSPLAIELSLRETGHYGGTVRLHARLKRPGARGGWINGTLAWNALEPYHFGQGELREDHLSVARELYAAHRARQHNNYSYRYGAEPTLDLDACDSPQLWSLLDEADRLGLALIHAKPALGDVRRHDGRLQLNVTRGAAGGATLRVVLEVDAPEPPELAPVAFVGRQGHGVVCARRADLLAGAPLDRCALHLVRLERAVAPELQRMALEGTELAVPADELARFGERVCPSLRNIIPIVSSDGSFTPPVVSAPELVLRAAYGDQHAVDIAWEWRYAVGARRLPAPLAPVGETVGFRDLDAESATLDEVALHDAALLRELGLVDDRGRPVAAPPAALSGIGSLRLTTEELPAIAATPGVSVEIVGSPVDYRAVDDQLEIGVATREIAGERDWFGLGVTITVEGRELPFVDVFAALARGEARMLLDDGAHFSLRAPQLQALRTLIDEARSLTDAPPGELRISRYQTGLWDELAAIGVVAEQARAWQAHVDALRGFDPQIVDPPAELAAMLRPYQREGFAWLAALWQLGLGGILADEMGLGKTLQTLALLCHARALDAGLGPSLVVAPTSVVSNWIRESNRFAPSLRATAITDTLAKAGRSLPEIVAGSDLVVTTYTLLRLDNEAYAAADWAAVILDEAQYVKNHRAKTYAAVVNVPARFKLAISGTPLENNLMELWALLSITAPGLFPDSKRFADWYARPIERGQDSGARLDVLRRRIRPLVKRRTKELVAADLPPKQEQTLEVELHPRHRKLYDTHLQRERQKVLQLIDDFDRNRFTVLRSITVLRRLSLHPGLVDPGYEAVPCAKLAALSEQLEDVVAGGHRALVFSQFTGFLDHVRRHLDRERVGYCYLDGKTRNRDRVLRDFKGGADPVFLISLKAGGLGLNLTEADYCFLLDPWWNPATEAQAIDRAHRIGQTRPVNVYRLISADTIETRVQALAARKAEMFRGVMDDGDPFAGGLTAEDIIDLLR